jgi:hypothetical protein
MKRLIPILALVFGFAQAASGPPYIPSNVDITGGVIGGISTLGVTGNVTFPGLLTTGTITTSLCTDASGHILAISSVNCFTGGGGMTYPSGTGIAVVTSGTSWGTTLSTGTASGNVVLGGTITAGGPIGSATVAPIITYNAAGQLTTVTSETITPAIGSVTGLGTGVGTALGVNIGSAGAPALYGGALGAATATTQNSTDNSTKVATTAFTQAAIDLSMSTAPINVAADTVGTISFDSHGSPDAVLTVGTVSSGAITAATVVSAGGATTAFKAGDVLSCMQTGSNMDAILQVATLSGNGVATVNVLYGGTGYTASTGCLASPAYLTIPYTFTLSGVLPQSETYIMTYGSLLQQSNQWIFNNNTTGAYTVAVKIGTASDTATGTGVVIPQGTNSSAGAFVQTDGSTDVICVAGSCNHNLGTPTAIVLTNATGTASSLTAGTASAVAVGGITGLGTGVGTALAVNVGTAGAPVINGGALGTPSSGTITNLSGTCTNCNVGGNAATATALANTGAVSTAATFYPQFVAANTTTNQGGNTATALTFNPSTGVLATTTFSGAGTALTGTASNLTAKAANGINSSTTTIVINGADAPTAGQVLTATSDTSANFQTPMTPMTPIIPYLWGDGSDGNVTCTGASSLNRNMYYSNLTVQSGCAINTNGYAIYASGTIDISAAPTGSFQFNGNAGGVGGAGTSVRQGSGGTAGSTLTAYTIGGSNPGYIGGDGGAVGGNSTSAECSGGIVLPAGAGGTGVSGSGYAGGTFTGAGTYFPSPYPTVPLGSTVTSSASPTTTGSGCSGPSGGGGAGNGSLENAGGGGGGATGGGTIAISANIINRGTNANTQIIQVIGGAGGDGGPAYASYVGGGGGGGGSGAGGGWVNISYGTITGSVITGAIDISGGAGGNGGNGVGTGGAGGYSGASGYSGRVNMYNIGSGTLSTVVPVSGTTTVAPSGLTGGVAPGTNTKQVNL